MQAIDTRAYRGTLHRTTAELVAWHAGASPEQALEPALPIIDPHHHLYGDAGQAHHYSLESMARDFSGGHKVTATVYVEAYEAGWRTTGPHGLRSVGEVERIVGLTRQPLALPPGPCCVAAGIVAHADLTLGDAVAQVLDALAEAGKGRLCGIRHVAPYDAGEVGRFVMGHARPRLLADPAFRTGFAQLARHGLSFDAWVYHPQLDDVIALADSHPNTTIVVNHVGGLVGVADYRTNRAAHLARWARSLRALAERGNVRIKIGGLGMPVFGFGFEHGDAPPPSAVLAQAWAPLIDTCVEIFGTGRCMLEGNFPVDKQSCGYAELWNAFKRATGHLSVDERADLFHRTASRTYLRLPKAH